EITMRRLWLLFVVVLVVSFSVLGWIGTRIYQLAPPIPDKVVTGAGKAVIDSGEIARGQNVWQSMGGMEVGSIWGHGSYVAPDWTADWLHRELTFVLEEWSHQDFNLPFDELTLEKQGGLRGRLETLYRPNTYDATRKVIVISDVRARAYDAVVKHFSDVFEKGETKYAIPAGSLPDASRRQALPPFISWP